MLRQLLNGLAVTLAFSAGAIVMALVLDLRAVQAYLGISALPLEDLLQTGLAFVATAAAAGLAVDGVRLIAASLWQKRSQAAHDLEDLFRANLA